ncbi:MAG: 16S rRNA (guanine(966)-N(2))-methyltransferase RsmD [Bacteroidota bacterium]
MRVIAGQYKGRRLYSVRDRRVRPATDRVKETIFNVLATRLELSGAAVLDLFAGTGSLGIEALSRGAHRAVFVEAARPAVQIIERNLKALSAKSCSAVVQMDAMKYIRETREQFDVVFADPPYAFEFTDQLPTLIYERHLTSSGGFLLIEHRDTVRFPSSTAYGVSLTKKFAGTVVTFFQSATST